MMRDVRVQTGRAFGGSAQWGYRARVDKDGQVSVYDDVAGHYTIHHALTQGQIAYVRRCAAERRA
jgi:hypothetical protein